MSDFIVRIHQPSSTSCLEDINEITISGITLVCKYDKFKYPEALESNKRKFGYDITIRGKMFKISGSNNYPTIAFRGHHLDIIVKNFPRYPAFYQDKYAAKSCLNGWGYTNYLNKGFPDFLKYRNVEIIKI